MKFQSHIFVIYFDFLGEGNKKMFRCLSKEFNKFNSNALY
jgi:hypothetical protein